MNKQLQLSGQEGVSAHSRKKTRNSRRGMVSIAIQREARSSGQTFAAAKARLYRQKRLEKPGSVFSPSTSSHNSGNHPASAYSVKPGAVIEGLEQHPVVRAPTTMAHAFDGERAATWPGSLVGQDEVSARREEFQLMLGEPSARVALSHPGWSWTWPPMLTADSTPSIGHLPPAYNLEPSIDLWTCLNEPEQNNFMSPRQAVSTSAYDVSTMGHMAGPLFQIPPGLATIATEKQNNDCLLAAESLPTAEAVNLSTYWRVGGFVACQSGTILDNFPCSWPATQPR